jgi:serine protease AprX
LLTTALSKRKDKLMPSSNLPPEEQPKVKPFDPVVLDRTVIAIPLLKEMQEDLELTAKVEMPQEFNAAIEFNKNFRGGAKAAREKVLAMAEDAKRAALEASTQRVERAENEFKASTDQLRPAAEECLADAKKRDIALHEAIEKQTIKPLQPKSAWSFAFLHATIIRHLGR